MRACVDAARPMATFEALTKEEIVSYDTEEFNFRDIIAKILSCEDVELADLHTTVAGGDHTEMITMAHDQCLVFHRMYYQSPLTAKVLEMYERMIRDYIAPMFKDDVIVYQKRPTFRVHLPNNVAVPSDIGGDPEKPGLHCDAQFNHPPGEINFWVPFTDTTEDNTMWLESERHKGDFHPAILGYGRALRFYGNQVFHYNRVNRCGKTRVSFDFRVIPLSQYSITEVKQSVQTGRRFTVGEGEMDYYSTYDKRTGGKYEFASRESSPSTVDGDADADAPAVEGLEYRL